MHSVEHPDGGYRYVPGISPYSAGVRAGDGHHIVRVALTTPTRWQDGFELLDRTLADHDRPARALCGVELRCPAPHSFDGFDSFNDEYRQALEDRGLLLPDGTNPIARTNVAPALEAGGDTELHAFSFTLASPGPTPGRPSFVISGAGDLRDQADLRPDAIVGGSTPWAESGTARAGVVLDEMERRMDALELGWADTDIAVLYTVESVADVLVSTILPRLGHASRHGVLWHYSRPPVEGLLFEMDTRGGVTDRRV